MRPININELTIKLNLLRQELDYEYSELAAELPYSNNFVSCLIKNNILVKQENGFYKFVNKPIHVEKVGKLLQEVREQIYKYKKNNSKTPEERAIEFLKERGYKIFKEI